jgi:hypothetical protein
MNYILKKPTGVRYYTASVLYFFSKWGGVFTNLLISIFYDILGLTNFRIVLCSFLLWEIMILKIR